jgi:hypothetical protein
MRETPTTIFRLRLLFPLLLLSSLAVPESIDTAQRNATAPLRSTGHLALGAREGRTHE